MRDGVGDELLGTKIPSDMLFSNLPLHCTYQTNLKYRDQQNTRAIRNDTQMTQRSHHVSTYTGRAITGLHWYPMGSIMYTTLQEPTDSIMLCSQTNHGHAMKSSVEKQSRLCFS